MFGNRHQRRCGDGAVVLFVLLGAAAEASATSDDMAVAPRANEAPSFAAQVTAVRYGFYRFEPTRTAVNAIVDPAAGNAGRSMADAGPPFAYVGSALETALPPSRELPRALTPVPEPSSVVLLLAGIGLFVLRGTVVWRHDQRRRGGRD